MRQDCINIVAELDDYYYYYPGNVCVVVGPLSAWPLQTYIHSASGFKLEIAHNVTAVLRNLQIVFLFFLLLLLLLWVRCASCSPLWLLQTMAMQCYFTGFTGHHMYHRCLNGSGILRHFRKQSINQSTGAVGLGTICNWAPAVFVRYRPMES